MPPALYQPWMRPASGQQHQIQRHVPEFSFSLLSSIAFSKCYLLLLFIFILQIIFPQPLCQGTRMNLAGIYFHFLPLSPLKCLRNTTVIGILCGFHLSKKKKEKKTTSAYLLFGLHTWGLGGIRYVFSSLVANFTLLILAKQIHKSLGKMFFFYISTRHSQIKNIL